MSMIRAQEYFAPLRSRHISLQQWERGLLFESWGRRGGRADRRKSGDLHRYMASDSEEQEIRPVMKKGIARSVSFSASFGREVGSEVKSKVFPRGLSFSRSLTFSGEIIPEDSDHSSSYYTCSRSSTDNPSNFLSKTSTGLLFSRSLERGYIGSEILDDNRHRSESDSDSENDCPGAAESSESRPWPKKFFSGSLSFSKDNKFFSGGLSSRDKKFFSARLSFTKPPGPNSYDMQGWGTSNTTFTSSRDHTTTAAPTSTTDTNHDGRIKNKFFSKVLAFSRSLDPRGGSSSDVRCTDTASTGADAHDNNLLRRGLSFSRSLDPDSDLLSQPEEVCVNSGSEKPSDLEKAPELSWPKKFISRSGLFFSKSLDPRRFRDSPSHATGKGSEKDSTEPRSKKLFGRGFSLSFSRFLDPTNDSSSLHSVSNYGPEKVDSKSDSLFKSLFRRGSLNSKSRTLYSREQSSIDAGSCGSSGSSGSKPKSLAKKIFSRDWSWSRSRSSSPSKTHAQQPGYTFHNSLSHSSADPANNPQLFETGSNIVTSSRHSQALRNWWSKRSQSTVGVSSKPGMGNDQNSRLVLLEKVPAEDDSESDNLTVYVGERGGSLTKYVLTKQIVQHHLFQVLLKCSQDELGTDYDYDSGVPIICDPALFLQVARVVGGNFSPEAQLCMGPAGRKTALSIDRKN